MSKRNKLTYTPANPSFLQELKRQIGLKNEPTVDTKVNAKLIQLILNERRLLRNILFSNTAPEN